MDEFGTEHLPGILPVAEVVLRVLINPDGSIYGVTLEERAPDGSLVHLETQYGSSVVDDRFLAVIFRQKMAQRIGEATRRLRHDPQL